MECGPVRTILPRFLPDNSTPLTWPRAAVFSRCADSVEDGRRLENLSWRVWTREMLCCEPQAHPATTPAIDITKPTTASSDVPLLSTSVDSVASEHSMNDHDSPGSTASHVDIASRSDSHEVSIQRISQGKEKHITSLDLERMVYTIQEQQDVKEPLAASIADAIPTILPSADIMPRPRTPSIRASLRSSHSSASTEPRSSPDSDRSGVGAGGSDTSAELITSHSVIRGFSTEAPSSYKSATHLAAPPASAIPMYSKAKSSKLSGVKFSLGCGSSSPEGSSLDESMRRQSSLTSGLKHTAIWRKQTSFKDELHSRAMNHKSTQDENVFESSDEDEDDGPESAVEEETEQEDEDDDGSDWEDDGSDTGEGLEQKPLFKRIDSQPQLVSRRSLIADMVKTESERATEFQRLAAESSSRLRKTSRPNPNRPSLGDSPDEAAEMLPPGMTRSKPIITTTSNTHPPALSPRTTRRNMLASEMTESLRKHLLWERQQISTTAKAVLKRRHTAFDIANLKDYPEKEGQTSKNNSWNHFFDQGGEYNQAGW